MAKPVATIPLWATDPIYLSGPQVGLATKLTPLPGKIQQGWLPGEKPAARYWNDWANRVGIWAGWAAASASNFVDDDHIVQTDAFGVARAHRFWAESEEITIRANNTGITRAAVSASVPALSPFQAMYGAGGEGSAVEGEAFGENGIGVKGTAGTTGDGIGVLGAVGGDGGIGVKGAGAGAGNAGGYFIGADCPGVTAEGGGAYPGVNATGGTDGHGVIATAGGFFGASTYFGLYAKTHSSADVGARAVMAEAFEEGVGVEITAPKRNALLITGQATAIEALAYINGSASPVVSLHVLSGSGAAHHAIFAKGANNSSNVVELQSSNTATSGDVLGVYNFGASRGVYIEPQSNGNGLVVSQQGAAGGVAITADCGGTADLMSLVHSGTAGDGIDLLHSAATGNALIINKSGGAGYGIKVNSTATVPAVYIKHDGGNATAKEGLDIDTVGAPVAAPLRLRSVTSDPTTPNRGGIWFKDSDQCLKVRHAGGTDALWGSQGGAVFNSAGAFPGAGGINIDDTDQVLQVITLTGTNTPLVVGAKLLITAYASVANYSIGTISRLNMWLHDQTNAADTHDWVFSIHTEADVHTVTASWVYTVPAAGDIELRLIGTTDNSVLYPVLKLHRTLVVIQGCYD